MKKRIFAILMAAAILLGVAGCAQAPANNEENNEQEDITLNFIRIGNDTAEGDFWKQVISDFEVANPGIKINYDDAAIGSAMDEKLNTAFAGNAGYDIIGNGILSVASRAESGHYLPIDEYFASWEGKDDIMPALLANGTYKGKVYGLAYATTPYVFAYRKDLFEAAGLDPNSPPKTWNELKEYSKKLTVKKNGKITKAGFAFPEQGGNLVEFDVFVFGNGEKYVGDNGEPVIKTDGKIEALNFLDSFLSEVNIPYNNTNAADNPFIKGNAAMALINNVALHSMLKDPAWSGKIGLALPPSNEGKKQMSFCGCNMLFIGKDCKYPKEAFKFISYALSVDVAKARSETLKMPVTRLSLVDWFSGLDEMNKARSLCVENGIGMPATTWSPLFQKYRNEMVSKVVSGASDPTSALRDAQEALDAEIAASK